MKHVTLNQDLEIKIKGKGVDGHEGYFHLKLEEGTPIDLSRQFKKIADYFRLANPPKTGLTDLVINFETGETKYEELSNSTQGTAEGSRLDKPYLAYSASEKL